jgi:hypothetical protein
MAFGRNRAVETGKTSTTQLRHDRVRLERALAYGHRLVAVPVESNLFVTLEQRNVGHPRFRMAHYTLFGGLIALAAIAAVNVLSGRG